MIQQESTFWRRSLWERAGGWLDPGFALGGDFELWARFFKHADLYAIDTPLGGFRMYGEQRSAQQREQYDRDVRRALETHGGRPPGSLASLLRRKHTAKILCFNKNTDAWQIETIAL